MLNVGDGRPPDIGSVSDRRVPAASPEGRERVNMSRYFTLQEAESLIPVVGECLEAAINAKALVGEIDGELQDLSTRIGMLGGMEVDPDRIARRKLERLSLVRSIEESIREIQRSGCLVKDLDTGLLDFPALLNGVEVYLCWKLGESRIEWWHSTHEGYSGRRKIIDEFGDDTPNLRPN